MLYTSPARTFRRPPLNLYRYQLTDVANPDARSDFARSALRGGVTGQVHLWVRSGTQALCSDRLQHHAFQFWDLTTPGPSNGDQAFRSIDSIHRRCSRG